MRDHVADLTRALPLHAVLMGGVAFAYMMNETLDTPDLDASLEGGPDTVKAYRDYVMTVAKRMVHALQHTPLLFEQFSPFARDDMFSDVELQNIGGAATLLWDAPLVRRGETVAWFCVVSNPSFFSKMVLVVKKRVVHRLVEIQFTHLIQQCLDQRVPRDTVLVKGSHCDAIPQQIRSLQLSYAHKMKKPWCDKDKLVRLVYRLHRLGAPIPRWEPDLHVYAQSLIPLPPPLVRPRIVLHDSRVADWCDDLFTRVERQSATEQVIRWQEEERARRTGPATCDRCERQRCIQEEEEERQRRMASPPRDTTEARRRCIREEEEERQRRMASPRDTTEARRRCEEARRRCEEARRRCEEERQRRMASPRDTTEERRRCEEARRRCIQEEEEERQRRMASPPTKDVRHRSDPDPDPEPISPSTLAVLRELALKCQTGQWHRRAKRLCAAISAATDLPFSVLWTMWPCLASTSVRHVETTAEQLACPPALLQLCLQATPFLLSQSDLGPFLASEPPLQHSFGRHVKHVLSQWCLVNAYHHLDEANRVMHTTAHHLATTVHIDHLTLSFFTQHIPSQPMAMVRQLLSLIPHVTSPLMQEYLSIPASYHLALATTAFILTQKREWTDTLRTLRSELNGLRRVVAVAAQNKDPGAFGRYMAAIKSLRQQAAPVATRMKKHREWWTQEHTPLPQWEEQVQMAASGATFWDVFQNRHHPVPLVALPCDPYLKESLDLFTKLGRHDTLKSFATMVDHVLHQHPCPCGQTDMTLPCELCCQVSLCSSACRARHTC